jgi:putative DNA primase/helicase
MRAEELDTAPDYTGFMPSELLQEFAGNSLTPDMRLEKALLLVGMRGSGKSTAIEGVQEMVGPGRSGLLNIEDVVGSKYGYARIPGKTLLTGTEQPSVFIEHTHRIEALISGEPVHVEQKYERGYEYRPIAKILWGMNALPRIAQAGAGIFRRLLILRFPKALPPGAKDVDLKDKIRAEAPGIFVWALRGLKRLRERGDFLLPLSSQWALAEFEGAADTEGRFVAEVCDVGETFVVRPRDLHRAYKLWCKVTGHSPKNETNIANDWTRLGYARKTINGSRFWSGLRINADALDELKEQAPTFAHSLYTAY